MVYSLDIIGHILFTKCCARASEADENVTDPVFRQLTALGGTQVWSTLMWRSCEGSMTLVWLSCEGAVMVLGMEPTMQSIKCTGSKDFALSSGLT